MSHVYIRHHTSNLDKPIEERLIDQSGTSHKGYRGFLAIMLTEELHVLNKEAFHGGSQLTFFERHGVSMEMVNAQLAKQMGLFLSLN